MLTQTDPPFGFVFAGLPTLSFPWPKNHNPQLLTFKESYQFVIHETAMYT